MRTGISALTLVGTLAAMCSTLLFAAPQQPSQLLGTWEADLNESSFEGRAPYKTGKMTFVAVDAQNVRVICDVVTASGIPFHFEYEGPEDGSVVRVVGNPYYNSASMSWDGERTLKRTERRAGEITGTTTMVLAEDGGSFTASASRTTPEDGHLYTSVIVWRRVDK